MNKINSLLSRIVPNFRSSQRDQKAVSNNVFNRHLKRRKSSGLMMIKSFFDSQMKGLTSYSLSLFSRKSAFRLWLCDIIHRESYQKFIKGMVILTLSNLIIAELQGLSQPSTLGYVSTIVHLLANFWFLLEWGIMTVVYGALFDS